MYCEVDPDWLSAAQTDDNIAEYCETEIVNTYLVRLRYELFSGRLAHAGYAASETNLIEYNGNTKPHDRFNIMILTNFR